MSPELEQRIREAWEALPLPSGPATRRARDALLRRRRRLRRVLPFALVLVLALAAGLAAGRSLAPASGGPLGLGAAGIGFLPAEGWTVLQTGNEATAESPSRALAANVPVDPDDEPHRLPYRTLLTLPPQGVVIVASFTALPDGSPISEARELPLRFAEASSPIRYSAEVRPDRPLGQFQLQALVRDYRVELQIYFGTREPSRRARAEAQRQLDLLVVAGRGSGDAERRPAAVAPPAVQSAVCPRFAQSVKLHFGPTGPVYPGQTRPTSRSRYALALTDGAQRRGGTLPYLRVTPVSREIDAVCTPVRLRPNPSATRLGPRYAHRLAPDGVGWFAGPGGETLIHAGYVCAVPGRLVVHSSALRDARNRVVGNRFSVRMERTNELLAMAELRTGGAWFRVSSRCELSRYG